MSPAKNLFLSFCSNHLRVQVIGLQEGFNGPDLLLFNGPLVLMGATKVPQTLAVPVDVLMQDGDAAREAVRQKILDAVKRQEKVA